MPSPLSCIPALKPWFSIESYWIILNQNWIKIESTLNQNWINFGIFLGPLSYPSGWMGSGWDRMGMKWTAPLRYLKKRGSMLRQVFHLISCEAGPLVGRSMVRLGHIYTLYWMKTIYLWYNAEVSYWIKLVYFEWYIYIYVYITYNVYNVIQR